MKCDNYADMKASTCKCVHYRLLVSCVHTFFFSAVMAMWQSPTHCVCLKYMLIKYYSKTISLKLMSKDVGMKAVPNIKDCMHAARQGMMAYAICVNPY